MKKLTKLALAIGVVAVSGAASAVDLTLQESGIVYNNITGLSVDSEGDITVTGAVINPTTVPELPTIPDDGFRCGPDTEAQDLLDGSGNPYPDGTADAAKDGFAESCVGIGGGVADPSVYCSADDGLVWDAAEEMCVLPDTDNPTLTISASPSTLGDGVTTSALTFTFNEDVTLFDISDISVSGGGEVTGFSSSSASVYTATYERDGNDSGSVTISVGSNSYEDLAGNGGTSGSVTLTLQGADGDCPVVPGTVIKTGLITWGTSTGAQDVTPPTGDKAVALPIHTGSKAGFGGTFDFNGKSWTSNVTRKMWISECPGGEPLSTPSLSTCQAEGLMPLLKASQTLVSSRYCALDLNKTYYLNLSNKASTCNYSNGCTGIIAHKAVGNKD